jgi:hypothetical protein
MRRAVLAALGAAALTATTAAALPFKAPRARLKILALELDAAAEILEGDDQSADVILERARLALYRGACDDAVAVLERPGLEDEDEYAHLLQIAKGCARSTAATVVERDEARRIVVRFQDDEDRALFPILADTAQKTRASLVRDLGVELPTIWIDLVRDQFTLAAMTGLPERAAQTTGTVAVAKWGRVIMISPRAASSGYPWLDTLAHELTHLALAQGTLDRAPLWLQEGVAKREETRWREPTPFDQVPPPDAVAWNGIQTGLALPLTGLGPSIAMLPSAEQAAVAFAEVSSFVDFWVESAGPDALPKLVVELRDQIPNGEVSDAIAKVSGQTLAEWDTRWRAHLAAQSPVLRPELRPEAFSGPKVQELGRRLRLGELLLERRHTSAARIQAARAYELYDFDSSVRCLYADTLLGTGAEIEAARLFEQPAAITLPNARWWSLHEHFLTTDALPESRLYAIGHDPFDPPVPCEELPEGEYPADPLRRAICEAAWRVPR